MVLQLVGQSGGFVAAHGYAELGFSQLHNKRHDAVATCDHALQLHPNDASLLLHAGNRLTYMRRFEIAGPGHAAESLCPHSYARTLGGTHFIRGDDAQTIRAVSMMRHPSKGHRLLPTAHALQGQMDQARHHRRELMPAHPHFSIAHGRHVPPYRHAQDIPPFVRGLRLAGPT